MIDGYTYKRLEQVLEELEALKVENKTLKQKLSKTIRILKEIRKLMEKGKCEKKNTLNM